MAWQTNRELEEALVGEGLPICGCNISISEVHGTTYGATFIPYEGKYVRVDWQRRPTEDEKKRAAAVVARGCGTGSGELQMVDSNANVYPADVPPQPGRKISEVAAFYLYPRVWVGDRPQRTGDWLNLVSIFDEVCRKKIENGITMKVIRVGLFVFDFSQSDFNTRKETEFSTLEAVSTLQLRRLAVLNVYLLCLYAVLFRRSNYGIEKMVLSPMDTIAAKGLDDPHHLYIPAKRPDYDIPHFHELREEFFKQAAGGELLHYNAQMKWQQEDFLRPVLPADAVAEALELLGEILKHPADHALLLLDMFAHACKAYEDSNFSFSLVTCWTIAERLLHVLWERFMDEQKLVDIEIEGNKVPIMDSNRKNRLKNHRSFTSAVISEFLAFRGVIPFPTYSLLSKVRGARNGWVHELKPVSREQARSATDLVKIMLREVEGIDVAVPVVDQLVVHMQ